MADGLAELEAVLGRIEASIRDIGRVAGNALGAMANEEVKRQAVVLFGSDRRFSGSRRSKNARRQATASYKVTANGVSVFPSGDPWYIYMLGRGRSNIRPGRGTAALRTPFGPKASVHGGAMRDHPQALDPAVTAIADRAPQVIFDALDQLIGKL